LTTPTQVPAELVAGDLWTWSRDLTDTYPAGTWSGVWYFENAYKAFSVAATASGTVFSASVAAATTAALRPGAYRWLFVVTNGAARTTVESGRITLQADPAAAGNLDRRSHAQRVLDAIEAVIEGAATNDQQSMTIAGRSLQRRTLSELMDLRKTYRLEVQAEQSAADVAAGLGSKRRVFVRFGNV
jgi:hypothetical protein